MNKISENLNNFIRELSEIYDQESKDTYVSLYLNKDTNDNFIQRRIKACESILKGEELKNFTNSIKETQDVIKKNKFDSIAIFSSYKHNFLRCQILSVRVEDLLVVDSSPYLRPLARLQDEWESFTLVLVSTNYAKIFSISLGKIDDTKKLSADIINKHKKGGQSQARFNRIRRGAINAFLNEVVEALQKRVDERIILAGPGQAKIQLKEILPKNLSEKIIDVVDIDINDEKKLLKKSIYLISEREKRQSHEAVQHLKEEILKDGLAVYGGEETISAVKNGQVELLIIEKNRKIPGWICEHCQIVKQGISSRCYNCGKSTSKVDVIEEILEFAERTDAEIEFTDDEEIAKLGHVGAILRFKYDY